MTTAIAKWVWVVGAFVVVLAATAVPRIGPEFMATAAALMLGALAAWWVLRHEHGTFGQGIGLAALVGVGALVASLAAFTVLGFVLGNTPAIQDLIRTSEPHPEARLPYEWMPSLGAVLGSFIGFGAGVVNLLLAIFGSLIAGLASGSAQRQQLGHAIG